MDLRPANLDRSSNALGADAPVPVDRPFTTAEAHAAGVSRRQLDAWVAHDVVRHSIRGVFHARQLTDSLDLTWSGERRLRPTDVVTLGGLRVTTPLRTACDMGRLLSRDRAFAAMDAMAGRWLDVGLPRPVCQVPARSPYGTTWWIDLGLPERRFGAEYDGAEFHGDDRREHDERRRVWLAEGEGWDLVIVRRENLFGHGQDVDQVLRRAARRHGLLA